MIANYYSKVELRILFLAFAALFAVLFAVSAAKGATSGRADVSVVNPKSNVWKMQSSDGEGSFSAVEWGLPGDLRVPADYDGDGIDDIAIWRPTEGRWYVLTSKTGFYPSSASISEWGKIGDVPVPADYDGDGKTDAAVFRSTQNCWYIAQSKTGDLDMRKFGIAGKDVLVPADYTGDGRADLAVFRSGVWYLQDSASHQTERFEFGFADSQPVPADYDGDGKTDFATYRLGTWYIFDSGAPRLRSLRFGRDGEVPLNSLSVKPSIVAAN